MGSLKPSSAVDALLEEYLQALDRYTRAQDCVGRQFASAFFSLAQANRVSGRRMPYGPIDYDERAQALLRVEINQPAEDPVFVIRPSSDSSPRTQVTTSSSEPKQAPTPPKTPTSPSERSDTEKPERALGQDTSYEPSSEKTTSATQLADPIRQFGILVPPILRTAQRDFRGALTGESILSTKAQASTRLPSGPQELAADAIERAQISKAEVSAGSSPVRSQNGTEGAEANARLGLTAMANAAAEMRRLEQAIRRQRQQSKVWHDHGI